MNRAADKHLVTTAQSWRTESEMTIAFATRAKQLGFKVYPETSDFDLVLVATPEVCEFMPALLAGDQIGIQAKLRANLEVLAQIAHPYSFGQVCPQLKQPHYRAVLVQDPSSHFRAVAANLGVVTLDADFIVHCTSAPWGKVFKSWHRRGVTAAAPLWLPHIEAWTPPGVPAPKQITEWKMKAMQLCCIGVTRGYLTKEDFADAKVAISRWHQKKWITGYRCGPNDYRYSLTPKHPGTLYPDLFEQVKADMPK